MREYAGHVVRRGVEIAKEGFKNGKGFKNGNGETITIQIPGWALTMVSLTAIIFAIFLFSVEYTLKDVVATLTMVESPSADISLTAPSDEDADPLMKNNGNADVEDGPAITLVRNKPITSSIRSTLRHLKTEAGSLSKWRGIVPFFAWSWAHTFIANILDAILPNFLPGRILIFAAAAAVLCAPLHAAWTHTVISVPSNKRFWNRITPRSSWSILALPAAVEAVAVYASIYVTMGFFFLLRLDRVNNNSLAKDYKNAGDWIFLAMRFASLIAAALLTAVFIILPATVTLVRVEASLLPEEDEAIVPFDRSFAGKVVPTILGGSGAIGFLDAWRSFNWEARRRLIKLYIKITAIMFVITFVMMTVMGFELWLTMSTVKKSLQNQMQGF